MRYESTPPLVSVCVPVRVPVPDGAVAVCSYLTVKKILLCPIHRVGPPVARYRSRGMEETPNLHSGTASEPQCDRKGSCLFWEPECRCDVIQLIDDTFLAVRPPPGMKCPHKLRYQNIFLCTSPARKEIYRRSQA